MHTAFSARLAFTRLHMRLFDGPIGRAVALAAALGLMLMLVVPAAYGDALERAFVPDADLIDERWLARDDDSTINVDHGPWSDFLDRYRSLSDAGVALIAYGDVTPDDRRALKEYLERLQATAVEQLNHREQLAFWINLYNAATVDLLVDKYPVESIRDIRPGFLNFTGPWDKNILEVDGQKLSLNDIEHGIIRPIWPDPRLHMVLNCAAIGCPNQGEGAYLADQLDTALQSAAQAYLDDPRGLHLDEQGRLVASKIFDWYRDDFGGKEGVVAFMLQYVQGDVEDALSNRGAVDRFDYDWALNDSTGRALSR